jgi:hypothetical protein
MNDLETILQKITSNEYFLRLKSVVENSPGSHDHEDVYSHCVKTASIAKEQLNGDFITNKDAKEKFSQFMSEAVLGMQRKDIVVLIGLLHDCGKLLSYQEDGQVHTLISKRPTTTNQTYCPGHEYWGGSLVVKEILKDIEIDNEIKKYIATIVRLHGVLNFPLYYTSKSDWSINDVVSDIKSQAEGYYIEALFNAYCDCYTASSFAPAKDMIEKIFSHPTLYIKRNYFIS